MISLTKNIYAISMVLVVLYLVLLNSNIIVSIHAQNSSLAQNMLNAIHIPKTISNESQQMLKDMSQYASTLITPSPDAYEEWNSLNHQVSSMFNEMSQSIIDLYKPTITSYKLNNVSVLDIKPKDWRDNGQVLVYVHGGGFTFLSANSTLGFSVPVANSTGLKIISVDYSLAPFSKWDQTTNEVIKVIQTLTEEQGYSPGDIVMFGDSAGGNIVTGTVLKMRDMGLGIPSAVILWSPWVDITGMGDTYITLDSADPFSSYNSTLKNMADAYAHPTDQKNPYVSAIYGNFSKGFPPTLIQGGTKEILLSDFIRFYQILDQTGIPVKLDIYEGMPHVFQSILHGTPESDQALSKMNDFLQDHLMEEK